MTLTITLTFEEEVRLRVAAQKEGIDPAELVHQLVKAHLPPTPDANAASIALLQSWLAEDATNNPDDIQQAQAELDAFKQAINAECERAGARRIYPYWEISTPGTSCRGIAGTRTAHP